MRMRTRRMLSDHLCQSGKIRKTTTDVALFSWSNRRASDGRLHDFGASVWRGRSLPLTLKAGFRLQQRVQRCGEARLHDFHTEVAKVIVGVIAEASFQQGFARPEKLYGALVPCERQPAALPIDQQRRISAR